MDPTEFKLNLAVVIGINDYRNGIPALGTARQDAEAIATILQTDYQYQVHLLTESQAIAQNLQRWLETDLPEAIQQANPSRLVFYFAGHGIALNGDEGPQGYLIPQDAKLGEVSTYLPMQQVEAALTKLSCRHCLVILDCCFAGAFRWSSTRKLVPITETIHKERFDRFIQDPAWQVITSAASDQFALDNLDLKGDRGIAKNNTNHSPFAIALMSALSGSADAYPPASNGKPAGDGVITATELYMYLRDAVEVPTDAKNQRQTPQIWCLKKHDKGEFIFLPPGHKLNLPPAPSLDELEDHNPYRGLKSYETKDSALFFGRTALIDKLCDAMSDRAFTVVLGASGSGKSSLVKAGLIAHLDGSAQSQQSANQRLKPQENPHVCKSQKWQILTPIRPGESPLNSLNGVLKELGDTDQVESKTLSELISIWSQSHPQTKLLLVIDQLEELITLCRNDEERRQFLDLLADLVKAHPEVVRLVVTLRSDFEPQLRSTPLEPLWQDGRFVVPAMTRDELRSVIEEPASAQVVYFESLDNRGYLVDQLIDEVAGMPGALLLLSFALSELYLKLARRYLEAQNTGNTVERAITWGDYDALGGVTKSLTQRADEVYEDLVKVDPAYEKTIRHVMLRMVAVGGELARRQVPESELGYPEPENGRVQEVLSRFSAARLLVSGTDADDKPYIEPAHDALVRGWDKLLTWKKEEENLILQRRLTPAAVEWESAKNNDKEQPKGILDNAVPVLDVLDRGFFSFENLVNKIPAMFIQLLRRSQNQQKPLREKPNQFLWDSSPYLGLLGKELLSDDNWLNQVEGEFVQESVLQKRRNISWRWRIAIGVVLGLSGLTITALISQRDTLISQIQIAIELSQAQSLSNHGLESLLSSLQAGKLLKHPLLQIFKPSSRIESKVIYSIDKAFKKTKELNRIKSSQKSIVNISISSNGEYLASVDSEGSVAVWKLSGEKILEIKPQKKVIQGATFSPDGKILATKLIDGSVSLWNLQAQKISQVETQNIILLKDNFYLWKKTKTPLFSGKHIEKNLNGDIVINSSNQLIVADDGKQQGAVNFKILGNKPFKEFETSQGWYLFMTFSPNGKFMAINGSANWGDSIKIWSEEGKELANLEAHKDWPNSISFSYDNKLIATAGSRDDLVRLWDLQNKQKIVEFPANQLGITSLSFNPISNLLATGGNDGTIRLWDFNRKEQVSELLNIQDKSDNKVLSINGNLLATVNQEGFINIFDLNKQKKLISFQGYQDRFWAIIFSIDGNLLVTGQQNGIIRIWDWKHQRMLDEIKGSDFISSYDIDPELARLTGFPSPPWGISISSDNQILAIPKFNTFYLWDWKQNKKIIEFPKVDPLGFVDKTFFSSDNKYIVAIGRSSITSQDGIVTLWDLNGKLLSKLENPYWITNISFSPDNKFWVTADQEGFIQLRNISGDQLALFKAHQQKIEQSIFSPDGHILATLDKENIVKLWDIKNQEQLGELLVQKTSVLSMAFSKDSKNLIIVGNDGVVRLWTIPTLNSSLAKSCNLVFNYLKNLEKGSINRRLCDDVSSQELNNR